MFTTYTKQEIIEATAKAALVETYKQTDLGRGIHTDNIKYIGTGTFDNQEIENLPYDENGEIEVDITIMDKEEYTSTVLANCCEEWPEDLSDDDTIAVIIVKNK